MFELLGSQSVFPKPQRKQANDRLENLSPRDRELFFAYGWGARAVLPYDCVHHAFENQAQIRPEAKAATHEGKSMTYAELDHYSNRVAQKLKALGVRPGDHVGLFVQRSLPMLAGILGILKTGAAYVPQHIGVVTDEQLRHVVETAEIKVALTLEKFESLVPEIDGLAVQSIEPLFQPPFDKSTQTLKPENMYGQGQKEGTCFVLFTSGTTGMPNGVQVTHNNVCNIIHTHPGGLSIKPGQKVSQILSISFDMAAWEILGCLSHGGELIIRGKSLEEAAIKADVIIATPSILNTFDVSKFKNTKVVAVAGEPCPEPLAERWSKICTFYNNCGPTETTIVNTMHRYVQNSGNVSIGKPTPNNTVYVLDENLKPLPIGEIGEMWAGGDCVSAGYLNNEELNSDRYREDPFVGGGAKMFRTRDLGRWNDRGELEHFGRTDDQVKIRGFRVELDSITSVLESAPDVQQAVTLKLNSRDLVAFVSPLNVNVEKAKASIEASLPYYCVPREILAVDSLPRTDRGKIDKRYLTKMAVEVIEMKGE